LIAAASGGTLFLDEIVELPLDAQVKLLRVLQESEVVRVGETKPRSVDIRVLSASHTSLQEQIREGKFREDLFYRLLGFEVSIPPLRERVEDIPMLAEHFLALWREVNKRKEPVGIHRKLLSALTDYAWPGNVRELKNVVEVGAALARGKDIKLDVLPKYLQERLMGGSLPAEGAVGATGWYMRGKPWKEHELIVYASALLKLDFDVPRVATSLGVSVATVYKWLRENKIKEMSEQWEDRVLEYNEGTKLDDIRKQIFQIVARQYPKQPYLAARELSVAPVTFYRWSKA